MRISKLSLILGLFLGFTAVSAKAQSNADYFVGKWAVTIIGTPGGDAKMNFIFQKADSILTGVVQDSTGKEISKVSQIDEQGKSIIAAFTAQSYDLTLTLEPVDNDHVRGSLISMFEAKGIRIKEND